MAANTVKVGVCGGLEEAAEHGTERAGEPENHCAFANLARCVPRAQEVVNTRVEAGSDTSACQCRSHNVLSLEQTDEETKGVERLERLDTEAS